MNITDMQAGLSLSVTSDGGRPYLQGQLALENKSGRFIVVNLTRSFGTALSLPDLEVGEYVLTRYDPNVLWQAQHLR